MGIPRAEQLRLTQQPQCEVAAVQDLLEAVQADTHAGTDMHGAVVCIPPYKM